MDIKKKIVSLPLTSGVYIMKNAAGGVVYVGKAVCLRKRVQSHFRSSPFLSKSALRTAEVADIECLVTASEAEALILEASLIKRFKPKYNIELRDDKSYPYIEITDEAFPVVRVVRPHGKKKGRTAAALTGTGRLYGPYVEAYLIREALKIIRAIFPFRTCRVMRAKACLDYHIGLCPAPCIDAISQKSYAKTIRNVRHILEGKKDTLYRALRAEMEACVRVKDFERAAQVRDQIRSIGALYSGTADINYYKESEQLQRVLKLPRSPARIEAFDISNIMGAGAVGAMVSFLNGKPDKSNYRRFRIRSVDGIDDCRMIAEVVRRRYRRLKNEGKLFPDLIIIDGGKGQLSSALGELHALDAPIPVISIAKQAEEIFVPQRAGLLILEPGSLGLQLIRRIRDEVHRFAITYHRKVRGRKSLYGSPFQEEKGTAH